MRRILAEEFGVSAGQVANVRRVLLCSLRQTGLIGADGRLTAPLALDAPNDDHPLAQPQQADAEAATLPSENAAPSHADGRAPATGPALPAIAIPLEQVPLTVRAWLTRMPPEGADWPETQYEQWHAGFRAMTDDLIREWAGSEPRLDLAELVFYYHPPGLTCRHKDGGARWATRSGCTATSARSSWGCCAAPRGR